MAANPRAKVLEPQALPAGSKMTPPQVVSETTGAEKPRSETDRSGSPRESLDSSHEAIARSAYFLAEARGFEPGYELDDWLAAEQQANG